ncbi:MAG: hypothetical protein ACT4NY_23610 [Pseudonocardiales bacterium]
MGRLSITPSGTPVYYLAHGRDQTVHLLYLDLEQIGERPRITLGNRGHLTLVLRGQRCWERLRRLDHAAVPACQADQVRPELGRRPAHPGQRQLTPGQCAQQIAHPRRGGADLVAELRPVHRGTSIESGRHTLTDEFTMPREAAGCRLRRLGTSRGR